MNREVDLRLSWYSPNGRCLDHLDLSQIVRLVHRWKNRYGWFTELRKNGIAVSTVYLGFATSGDTNRPEQWESAMLEIDEEGHLTNGFKSVAYKRASSIQEARDLHAQGEFLALLKGPGPIYPPVEYQGPIQDNQN